ncbi:MAG: AraC family transcriptional regulator [Cytophagales bacterium]|nr:MAG: AraC family transcriptional regulator [Cytophagales bacterium]
MKKPLFTPQKQLLTPTEHLDTLVEHKSIYTLENCELNIFETHQRAENVKLCFDSLTFTAMLRGKKVMHLFGSEHFDYLPGESVIVPAQEEMLIDFPEATAQNPTQCIALAIDSKKIKQTMELLNEKYKKVEHFDTWQIHEHQYHLKNSEELVSTIDRLVHVSRSNDKAKDIFAELALQELLIRLMQSQARQVIFEDYQQNMNRFRFAYVVKYIKENIANDLTVKRLSDLACMSESHFFKSFKRELGISPMDFVVQERIHLAKKMLQNTAKSITDICFELGFNSVNYFSTLFKKYEKVSPKSYREQLIRKK